MKLPYVSAFAFSSAEACRYPLYPETHERWLKARTRRESGGTPARCYLSANERSWHITCMRGRNLRALVRLELALLTRLGLAGFTLSLSSLGCPSLRFLDKKEIFWRRQNNLRPEQPHVPDGLSSSVPFDEGQLQGISYNFSSAILIEPPQFSNLCGTVYRQGNIVFTPDGNSVLSPVGNRVSVFDLVK